MANFYDLHNVIIEFPENTYVMTINKSSNSDYEYVTMASSYKQTASYLFRWFRNMQSSCNSENARERMAVMIEVFQTYKEELFVSLREYVLIEGIILTCFSLQLDDSDLICQVLYLMYQCWSSFGPLHFKAVLGRYQRQKGKQFEDLLSFFLEHARRNRLEFNGIRMIDLSIYSCISKAPIFLAVEVWSWKKLLIYLQYGAKCEDLLQDPTKSYYGLSSALADTFRTLVRHLWFRLVSPACDFIMKDKEDVVKYCANLDSDVRILCRTVNILLRVVRRIYPPGCLDYMIKDTDEENIIRLVSSSEVLTHCTVQVMIPKIFLRYDWPEELKHICRWTIRKRLNENWQLPHGIRSLPIPQKLQQYLNLLID